MLEPILKGLVEWIYSLMVDIMEYASGELLGVLSMDLEYFENTAPVITSMVDVFISLGWALLMGNMVFQLLKAIMSGAGFEAEDPKIIFLRNFAFSFLLMASRQICDIGLSITGKVIDLLEIPSSIDIVTPDESMFTLGSEAKWLIVIIVGVVFMVQMVKLLFEIGERYVITSVLTFFSPLAFAMGGSKNTSDIFKGWCRMYGSMMILMIMNIVFLKLIMSAMSQITNGGVLIWIVFVVALTRVARKIDSHIGKLGLNPAQTGEGFGSRIPGVMTMMAVRAMGSAVSRSISGAGGASRQPAGAQGSRDSSHRSSSFVNKSSVGERSRTDSANMKQIEESSAQGGININSDTAGGNEAAETRFSRSANETNFSRAVSNNAGEQGHVPHSGKSQSIKNPSQKPVNTGAYSPASQGGRNEGGNVGSEERTHNGRNSSTVRPMPGAVSRSANVTGSEAVPDTIEKVSTKSLQNETPNRYGKPEYPSKPYGHSENATLGKTVGTDKNAHTGIENHGEIIRPQRGNQQAVASTGAVAETKMIRNGGGSAQGQQHNGDASHSLTAQTSYDSKTGNMSARPPLPRDTKNSHAESADVPVFGAHDVPQSEKTAAQTVRMEMPAAVRGSKAGSERYVPTEGQDKSKITMPSNHANTQNVNISSHSAANISHSAATESLTDKTGGISEKGSAQGQNHLPSERAPLAESRSEKSAEIGRSYASKDKTTGGTASPARSTGEAALPAQMAGGKTPSGQSGADISSETSFTRGGDTNIEAHNSVSSQQTLEKHFKPEEKEEKHFSEGRDEIKSEHEMRSYTSFSRNELKNDGNTRINHEYAHGKYDPAAKNGKSNNKFIVKEGLRAGMREEKPKTKRGKRRGGKDGTERTR